MQEEVLERYPDADLRVYVVWLPVLPLDERFVVADVMVDARASHFWDNDQLVSDDLAQAFGSEGQLVWDAFFAFGGRRVGGETTRSARVRERQWSRRSGR